MKRITTIIGVLVISLTISVNSVSAASVVPAVDAQAATVVDVQTGQVLADKNGAKRIPIASISKLLTVYLVEREIAAGKLTMETPVKVPAEIATISTEPALANVPLSANRTYTVKELMEMALIKSANAAALALGYAVSGTPTGANAQIEQLLASWGIKNVTIVSAAGLTNGDMGALKDSTLGDDVENALSARELAVVGRHLVQDFPQVIEITKMTSAVVPSGESDSETITNSNQLLDSTNAGSYVFEGLKTGYAASVHSTFIGLTTLENRQVLTVVLGSDHTFTQTVEMLNQIRNQLTVKTLSAGQVVGRITVPDAEKTSAYPVSTQDSIGLFVPKSWSQATLTVNLPKESASKAPLKKQATVVKQAKVEALGGDKKSEKLVNDFVTKTPTVKIISKQAIPKASEPVLWWRSLVGMFSN